VVDDSASGPHVLGLRNRAVPPWPTVLAALLAAVAGAVDAICFNRVFDVFPANQSGNSVLLGIALGTHRGEKAWRPGLAIVGFALGVSIAILLGSRISRRRRPELLLTIEVVVLAPLAIVVLTTPHPGAAFGGAATAALLLATTVAMGIQTEVIGRVAGVAVATTYQSGAIVRIAEQVTRAGTGRPTAPPLGPGVVVLLVVLASYVGGAALGASLGAWPGSMFVPVGVLAVWDAVTAVGGGPLDLGRRPSGQG